MNTDLDYLIRFYRNGMANTLSHIVKIYILEHGEANTVEIADHIDTDVVNVSHALGELKRAGYVERVKLIRIEGLAMNSRTGKLATTSRMTAVYKPTDKLTKVAEC